MSENSSKTALTGAIKLFSKSYAFVKENLSVFMLIFSVGAIFTLIETYRICEYIQRHNWDVNSILSSAHQISIEPIDSTLVKVLYFSFLVLGSVIGIMIPVLTLRTAQGFKPDFRSVWNEVTSNWLWLKLIFLGFLTLFFILLCSAAPMLLSLLCLMLFSKLSGIEVPSSVAGVIAASIFVVGFIISLWRLYLAPYLMIDKKTTAMQAIKQSWKISKGYCWAIWSIILFSMLLMLSSYIPFIGKLLSFVLAACYSVAPALRYLEIKSVKDPSLPEVH